MCSQSLHLSGAEDGGGRAEEAAGAVAERVLVRGLRTQRAVQLLRHDPPREETGRVEPVGVPRAVFQSLNRFETLSTDLSLHSIHSFDRFPPQRQ